MTAERSSTMWDRGTLRVTATLKTSGDVVIYGHDLGHPLCEEYEYWITVRSDDVARLVDALGGEQGTNPLDLLQQHGEELVTAGEKTWIEDHGIVPEFFNRMGAPRSSDGEDHVPSAAPASWAELGERVDAALQELEPDEYLVLDAAHGRFVQVMVQDFALRVESVSNHYLGPADALADSQIQLLDQLGFHRPTHGPEADDDAHDGSVNHWMDFPTDTPRTDLARLLVDTLQQVHNVDSPRDLTYECSTLLGEFIPQPTLGLARSA